LGKTVYLVLFPGLAFAVAAGMVAISFRSAALSVLSKGVTGSTGIAGAILEDARLPSPETFGGLAWLAPAVTVLALSWASCLLLGFFGGDVFLLLALLLLSAGAEALFLSELGAGGGESKMEPPESRGRLLRLAWFIPLGMVLAGVCLRTGRMEIAAIVEWQATGGPLVSSSAGGAAAQTGTVLGFASAILCCMGISRARPAQEPLFAAGKLSAPPCLPLAIQRTGEAIVMFISPLVLWVLFMGGIASGVTATLLGLAGVAGLFVLFAVADAVSARWSLVRPLWLCVAAGALSLTGLVMVWVGVS
jgi:hypothetical protein